MLKPAIDRATETAADDVLAAVQEALSELRHSEQVMPRPGGAIYREMRALAAPSGAWATDPKKRRALVWVARQLSKRRAADGTVWATEQMIAEWTRFGVAKVQALLVEIAGDGNTPGRLYRREAHAIEGEVFVSLFPDSRYEADRMRRMPGPARAWKPYVKQQPSHLTNVCRTCDRPIARGEAVFVRSDIGPWHVSCAAPVPVPLDAVVGAKVTGPAAPEATAAG